MNATTETVILDIRKHPAVQAVEEKRRRAEQDIKRLETVAADNERLASEKRQELGRAEVAASMGDEPETPVDELKAKLEQVEGLAKAAREEVRRRQGVIDDGTDLREAVRTACREFSEAAEPEIRELTAQYVELVARTYEVEKQLTAIYSQIQNTNWKTSTGRYKSRHRIQTPHDSPILRFKTNPKAASYDRAMDDYLRGYRERGYDV